MKVSAYNVPCMVEKSSWHAAAEPKNAGVQLYRIPAHEILHKFNKRTLQSHFYLFCKN